VVVSTPSRVGSRGPATGFRVAAWLACALTCLTQSTDANAASQRVTADFYGVAYPRIGVDTPAMRDQQLSAIARTGIDVIRITIPWYAVQPDEPGPLGATYDFAFPDQLIRAAASHGLRAQVTFAYTPDWASGANASDTAYCNLLNVTSVAPGPLQQYASALGAVVRRYGEGGSFWRANLDLPRLPVTSWEVWNEPNLKGYWCPAPEPERYANMFVLAAREIERADPSATIVSGGVPLASPSNSLIDVSRFFSRALRQQPRLLEDADAVGIHAYPHGDLDDQMRALARFRSELREGGVPNSMPMAITEIGWSIGGEDPLSETERAERMTLVTRQVPRINCNVSGMVVHAWTTIESDRRQRHQWYGIARPADGAPYPSALNFAYSSSLMLGSVTAEPPVDSLTPCEGMKVLDRDRGGVPDHRDYFPLDPSRSEGPVAWSSNGEDAAPGGGGGGGGGGDGDGDGSPCTVIGDGEPNVLMGTAGRDILCGFGGNDVIMAQDGNDLIRGGPGRDLTDAGAGRDRVLSGPGPDTTAGGRGRDRLVGGGGRDRLYGGPGRDRLKGGPGRDVIRRSGPVSLQLAP
jgi:hypothetical protein